MKKNISKSTKKEIALRLEGINKSFGKVKAIDNGELTLYKGEILAILGENGSGKTSLMNVIAGIYCPDEGTIKVNGKLATIHSPNDAFKYHIGMVHQHFKLVNNFTGIDNVLLGLKNEKYNYKDALEDAYKNKKERDQLFVDELKKDYSNCMSECAIRHAINRLHLRKFNNRIRYARDRVSIYLRKFFSFFGLLNKDRAREANKIAQQYGFNVDLNKTINEMSVSEKQSVEIIKTLYRGVNILILDEPTAVLTPQEITVFFDTLRKMRDQGKSIIIITHKLNEVMAVSDRVTILRKGQYIDSVYTKNTNEKELTDMMVGAKTTLNIERKKMKEINPRLFVNNVTYYDSDGNKKLDDVSFTANGGEILGIAGVAGSGQKELLTILSGLADFEQGGSLIYHHPKKGKPVTLFHKSIKNIKDLARIGMFHDLETNKPVTFKGMKNKEIVQMVDDGRVIFNDDEIMNVKGMSPRQMKELGIRSSYVPEDRLGMGLVGNMDIVDNMMLRNYRKGNFGMLNHAIPTKLSREIVKQLRVATPSLKTQVSKLSGGNIQKLLVGREISTAPYVLTAAYPVRGLDINSAYTIYDLLNKQKEKGCAIIFVGEDLDVMLELCDRIVVMCGGKVTGEVDARKATKEEVGLLMTKNTKMRKEVR